MGSTTRWMSALVLLALSACGGGGGSGGNARIKVLVTDKRFDLDLVSEALVHVTKITLSRVDDDDEDDDDERGESQDGRHDDDDDEDDGDHDDDDDRGHDDDDDGDHDDDDDGDHDDDDDHGRDDDDDERGGRGQNTFVLYPGPGIVVSLLDLRDGIAAELATGEVPAGRYRMARLYIDDARLTLTNGNVYSTADGNLDLTCGNTSGLKIFFDPPLDVAGDTDTAILLDFDLTKTFKPIPPNDPLNATRYLLMPGIRAINRTTTGDLRGTVSEDDGAGGSIGVDTATIYVLPPGETDPAKSVATTASSASGTYAVLGLRPGTYDVLAVKDPKQGTATGVVITAAHETTLDLTIQ